MASPTSRVRRRRKSRPRQLPLPFDAVDLVDDVAPVLKRTGRTSKKEKPLVCYFGTPWLDHFDAPIGTGKGCTYCANYRGIDAATAEERAAHERSQSR